MSYDLYVLPIGEHAEIQQAWEAWLQAEEAESPPSPTAADLQRNDELAAELSRTCGLERFEFDYPAISAATGVTEQEARRRFQHVELNAPEDGLPIQITLYAASAHANVPYWHDDDRARATYETIFAAFRQIQVRTGWRAFDPQLERELDLAHDLDDVLAMHSVGVEHVRTIAESAEGDDFGSDDGITALDLVRELGLEDEAWGRKPRAWWQFWRR